jgi:hypothetical protein
MFAARHAHYICIDIQGIDLYIETVTRCADSDTGLAKTKSVGVLRAALLLFVLLAPKACCL